MEHKFSNNKLSTLRTFTTVNMNAFSYFRTINIFHFTFSACKKVCRTFESERKCFARGWRVWEHHKIVNYFGFHNFCRLDRQRESVGMYILVQLKIKNTPKCNQNLWWIWKKVSEAWKIVFNFLSSLNIQHSLVKLIFPFSFSSSPTMYSMWKWKC